MRTSSWTLALALSLSTLTGCHKSASEASCEKFADHFTKLLAEGKAKSGLEKTQAEGIANSLRDNLVKSCQQDAKESEVECILASKTIEDVQANCR